jgi:hypothetical protein
MPSYSPDPSLCISCTHIVNLRHDVLYVSYSGGDWVIVCDDPSHQNGDNLITIHHQHLVDRDYSIKEVMDILKIDQTAERKFVGDAWNIYEDPDIDD